MEASTSRSGPDGGPNFYEFGDDVLYEMNVDNNGDGYPDVTPPFISFRPFEPRPRRELDEPVLVVGGSVTEVDLR